MMATTREQQHEADRLAVREIVDKAQSLLGHFLHSENLAHLPGVRSTLEQAVIAGMYLHDHPTPLEQPRAAIEGVVLKGEHDER
jgi:hypothetical protein